MSGGAYTLAVDRLTADELVAVAQCIAIDAEAFPYASTVFGLRDSATRVWVARAAGDQLRRRVLGFIAGRVRSRVLKLDGLAVEREQRRRGIGRALVREALSHARERGLLAVALHVSVANRVAIALYAGEGFTTQSRLRGFYPAAAFDGEADAYEMVLPLA